MTNPPPSAAVAATVRAELARRGMSQVAVAAQMGVTQEYLSRRLRNRVPFNVDDLHDVARALEVDPVQLFAGGHGPLL